MHDHFWRKLAFLALPVATQILLQAFLGMADVAMVSGLGAEAVAAVGLAAKLHFLILVLIIGVASAGGILTAQHFGAKDMPSCQRTVAIALLVGAVVTLPFTLAFSLGYYWLYLLNPDPKVVELAVTYLFLTAPVVIVTQIVVVYESSLRSLGNTIIPLIIGALVVVLNVFLNYIFIFGHLGFPAMGVEGAAWGTLIARLLQLVVFWSWLYGSKHAFALTVGDFKAAYHWRLIRPFVLFALPVVVNHGIWAIGNSAYHVATGFAGTDALAVMGAMVPIESSFFALFIGLANACSIMIGQSLGANKPDNAWRLHKAYDRLALTIVVIFSVCLWFCRPWLVGLLEALDGSTAVLLTDTLSIFCLVVTIKIMNMMRILGVLRAGGDNHYCLMVDTVVMWMFGLPIFIFGVWSGWPFLTLYALMALEDALKFLPVKFRINKGVWVKNLTNE